MEVSIFEAAGLPEGAILSVRAGSTRRQAPVPLSGPLRFPNLPFNAKQFKVDVMQTLGSSKVEINANKELESYSVSVDIGSGQQARVGFTVREQPSLCGKRACELKQVDKYPEGILEEPSPVQLPPEKARAALDSRSYAREHNIPNLVQEMLQHVLREKPDSPFMVMSEYFKRKGEEMGEKEEGCKPLPPMFSDRQLTAMPPGPAPMGSVSEQTADPFVKDFAKDPFMKDPFLDTKDPLTGTNVDPYANMKDPYTSTNAPAAGYTSASAPAAAGYTSTNAPVTSATAPVTSSVRQTAAKDPFANTEELIKASDPESQARQRQLQSQMTYAGEYYVPNIPGEDPLAKAGSEIGSIPADFPEDPAAHIIQKAPPPLAADRGLPAPSDPVFQSRAPPPVAEDRGLPPPAADPIFNQRAAPPPGAYSEARSVPPSMPPSSEPRTMPEKVQPPTSKAMARGDNDPERLRLEAEHLSLQAEKASLLRELEILCLQQGVPVPPGGSA